MTRTLNAKTKALADWTADVRFFEYTSAADPRIPPVPFAVLPSASYQDGPSRVIPFDLSAKLQSKCPATTPNLLANFLRINPGDLLTTHASATSQLFYVVRGSGTTSCGHGVIEWSKGDLFVLPVTEAVEHTAFESAAIYWVHDEPLLHYLGAKPVTAQFAPTHFRAARLKKELDEVANAPGAEMRNRRGILLGNAATPLTLTVTHTLWSLLNVLPAGVVQKPHRHNSVALDLCVEADPGTYTMIGKALDSKKGVKDGIRADWIPGAAFVTPPGLWHSHHNESSKDAIVLPIQDAGLCTYMRILDIQFA